MVTADPAAPSPIEGAMTFGQLIAEQSPVFDTVATQCEDTAIILYTSGTTGFPKVAELSHANMTMNAIATPCASARLRCPWRSSRAWKKNTASPSWRGTGFRKHVRWRHSTTCTKSANPVRWEPPSRGVKVKIVDREDNEVDVGEIGGIVFYPREIEEVLKTHPAVSLSSVIGVPHDQHGEEITAYVVLNAGQRVTEEELVSWSKTQMAAFKYPRIIEIRESLPLTATGKILKKELKAEIQKA